MNKPENSSRWEPKRGRDSGLGDLVIANHHGAQLDIHRWRILSVFSRGKRCVKVRRADHVDIWEARFGEGYDKSIRCHAHQSVLEVTTKHGSLLAKWLTSLEVFSMRLNVMLPVGGECPRVSVSMVWMRGSENSPSWEITHGMTWGTWLRRPASRWSEAILSIPWYATVFSLTLDMTAGVGLWRYAERARSPPAKASALKTSRQNL